MPVVRLVLLESNDKMFNKKLFLFFILLISLISIVRSTDLVLQDADTENLDDGYLNSQYPTYEFGAVTSFYVKMDADGDRYVSYIKFDLTQVPSGYTVVNSGLNLYFSSNALDNTSEGWNTTVYHVYAYPHFNVSGSEWTEGDSTGTGSAASGSELSYNTRAVNASQYNATPVAKFLTTQNEPLGWKGINVTSSINKAISDGDKNITFFLNVTEMFGNPEGDFVTIRSKEYENATLRPYLTITYTETTPPTYTNWGNNASNSKYNDTIRWNITLSDNIDLDYYIFAHNISGTFVNNTPVDISGKNYSANFTWKINLTRGKTVCGIFWFNDSSANGNTTDQSCFTVANTIPALTASITPTPADPTDDLTGSISYSDVDSDTMAQNETKWYNNSVEVTDLVNVTLVGDGNTTNNDIWIFSARVYDGYNWSIWVNSSAVTIGDTTPPVIRNITVSNSSTIVPLNTIINLTANCTDASSSIGSVKFTYYAPSGSATNLSTTTHYGDIYYYELTLSSIGNWTFNETHCTDSSGNILTNNTVKNWVLVDNTAPSLKDITFSALVFYSDTSMNITVNCTDITSTISSAKVEINYSGVVSNYSMTQSGDIWYKDQTYVSGTHTVTNLYCIDSSTNINMTSSGQVLVVTERPTTPPSGGGGGAAEEPEDIVCNVSDEKYDITTATGREGYNFIIPYQTVRPITKLIYVTNYGIKNLSISFSCEQTDNNSINICDYITLSKNSTNIYANPQEPESLTMEISYPEGSTTKDEFTFNINSVSSYCQVNLNNRAEVNRISLSKWKALKLSVLNPNWKDFDYPILAPAIIAWCMMIILGTIIAKASKSPLLGIFIVGIILGGAAFVGVLFL